MAKFKYAMTLLFVIGVVSCNRNDGVLPVHLLLGFKSFESPEQVQAKLSSDTTIKKILKNSNIRNGSDRIEELSLEYSEYEHLGVTGTLSFGFFQNHLLSVGFYPESCGQYRDQLANHPTQSAVGHTSGTDFKNRCYFVWRDPTLQKRFEKWTDSHY